MRPFFTIWTDQSISLIGSQAVQFALIWWLTERTGSAAVLALAAFVGLFPTVAFGPFIGALIDRWNRKTIMLLADAGIAVTSVGLALLFAADLAGTTTVLVALFRRAVGGAFHQPAMAASTTLMVPEEHLTRIQGMNQALLGGLNIVAAPLGALLWAVMPIAGVMLVDVGSAFVAIVPLLFVHVPQPSRTQGETGESSTSYLAEIRDGFRYLRQRAGHMGLLAISATINLFLVPAFALLPLLVSGQLGGDAMQLGWMSSGLGVGMLGGGIVLGVWGGFKRRMLTTLTGLAALGVMVFVLGSTPSGSPPGHAIGVMFVLGALLPLVNGPIQAILQATVAPGFQGRVFALYGSIAGATTPIGLALAAPVAQLAGVRAWYWAGGIVCVCAAVAGLLIPAIFHLEDQEQAFTGSARTSPQLQ